MLFFRSHCKDAVIVFELFVLGVCCNFLNNNLHSKYVILSLHNTLAAIPKKNSLFSRECSVCLSVICVANVYNVYHDAYMCCV